jgi:hypothetical protein
MAVIKNCPTAPPPGVTHGSAPIVKHAGTFTKRWRCEFAAGGYGVIGMESVAHRAGLSTETLYRLFPKKAALLEGTMSNRLGRLLSVLIGAGSRRRSAS